MRPISRVSSSSFQWLGEVPESRTSVSCGWTAFDAVVVVEVVFVVMSTSMNMGCDTMIPVAEFLLENQEISTFSSVVGCLSLVPRSIDFRIDSVPSGVDGYMGRKT